MQTPSVRYYKDNVPFTSHYSFYSFVFVFACVFALLLLLLLFFFLVSTIPHPSHVALPCYQHFMIYLDIIFNLFCCLRTYPHQELLSVCLMNWPATFDCFCLARTKLDNLYHCVRTHCVGLTLLLYYPTFLLRKKDQDNRICFAREILFICVAKARVMIDVSNLSENGLPQRHALPRRNL